MAQYDASIRIKSSIDPEKAWLYDLNQENFKKLTPEQQKEWIAHNEESLKRLPEALERMKKRMNEFFDSIYSNDSVKTYQEAAEILRQEKNLTKEEKADLEYIEGFLAGYEEYKKSFPEDDSHDLHLDILPTGQAIHLTHQFINALSNNRPLKEDKNTEIYWHDWHEKDVHKQEVTRKNQKGTISVSFDDVSMVNKKNNKGFFKIFVFTLIKCNEQNYNKVIGFPLQELIEKGAYSAIPNARRAIKQNMEKIMALTFRGEYLKGNRKVKEEGGKLIYHYKIEDNYVKLWLNENFNIDFLAQFFTIMPDYSYSLNSMAFSLMYYIFYRARQSTKDIADEESFNIKLETIRAFLLLPTTEETKNHTHLIKNPIEKAIEEIELANNNKDFTLTLYHYEKDRGKKIEDCKNTKEWLNCYLEVGLHGDYAKHFLSIAKTTREKIEAGSKRKEKAMQRVIEKQIENASK